MSVFWSKFLGALLAPMSVILILLLLGAIGLWLPWSGLRSAARLLLSLLALGLLLLSLFPFERLYLGALEQRFPAASLPAEVTGIVVLGGGVSVAEEAGAPVYRLNAVSFARALAAAELARRYPDAKVVLAGGLGTRRKGPGEAELMAEVLTTLGIPRERLLLETGSRTTWENARLARDLAAPQAGEAWILVTSAFHMPRAVGAFRAAGWEVLAYPVAALAGGRDWLDFRFEPQRALHHLTLAEHEWLGLLAYRLAGQSSALFPAP